MWNRDVVRDRLVASGLSAEMASPRVAVAALEREVALPRGAPTAGQDVWVRAFLGLTGRYPRLEDVKNFRTVFRAVSTRRRRAMLGRLVRGREARGLRFVTAPRVIDITQYSRSMRMSGIPRVVRTLIDADAASGWSLAVWDRGALCPVHVDAAGRVVYPREYWRRAPRLPLTQRIYIWLRGSRSGAVLIIALEILGVTRILAAFVLLFSGWLRPRTRARVNVLLDDTRLFIPEVPNHADAGLLLAFAAAGGTTDIEIFVHDLLPLTNHEFFLDDAVLNHVLLLRLMSIARRVVTSSEVLRVHVEESLGGLYGGSASVTVAEIPVAPTVRPDGPPIGPGVGDPTSQVARGDAGPPRLVFVGGFEERKGLERLLDTMSAFDPGSLDIIVVGDPRALRPSEAWLARRVSATAGVTATGHVTDLRLSELLQEADAVLYLSHAEGYGLPILEALALGTPVVCADTPINRYFAERYGGMMLLPLGSDGGIRVRALRRALREAPWRGAVDLIRPELIPTDVERWATAVLAQRSG